METIEEENEEKKQSGWTRILLILNFIIWAIIVFMAIIFNGVVKAQGMNMTSWNYRNANDQWTTYQNGTTQALVAANAIGFNFDGTTGNNNGVVYLEADVIGAITTGDISIAWWTSPANNGTGTVSKNCVVTNTNLLTNHLKCQFNFTITNNSNDIKIIANFANARNMNNVTVSGYTDVQPTNNATTQDIINQTIQITNQIMESVQNSMSNVDSVAGDIVYSISSAIEDAAETIVGRDSYCKELEYNNDDLTKTGYIDIAGVIIQNNTWWHSDYLPMQANETYTMIRNYTMGQGASYCLYTEAKEQISCTYMDPNNRQQTIVPTQEGYIRFSGRKANQSETTIIKGEECKDRLEWIMENQDENTSLILNKMDTFEAQFEASYTHQTPNTSDFEDMEDVEDDLHQYTNVDLSSFNVDVDSSSANWVWTTLSSILNTSSLVFGMVISILSIGLIKLVLNR